MLEQKEVNENIIEELNDIDNKYAAKDEEVVNLESTEECTTCEGLYEDKITKPTFLDAFKASIIDLIVIGGISTIGVIVAEAILRVAGYSITQKFQMAFIMFMIIMVLYMSIMESGKTSTTMGKKICGLIITKR